MNYLLIFVIIFIVILVLVFLAVVRWRNRFYKNKKFVIISEPTPSPTPCSETWTTLPISMDGTCAPGEGTGWVLFDGGIAKFEGFNKTVPCGLESNPPVLQFPDPSSGLPTTPFIYPIFTQDLTDIEQTISQLEGLNETQNGQINGSLIIYEELPIGETDKTIYPIYRSCGQWYRFAEPVRYVFLTTEQNPDDWLSNQPPGTVIPRFSIFSYKVLDNDEVKYIWV